MSAADHPVFRWSVEQRLAFVDRRLYWDGKINRSDLSDYFSISTPQASADLSTYDSAAPGNMVYDPRAKAYLATKDFQPRTEPSARQYMAQLQMLADDVLHENESWLGWVPPFGVVPRVRRRLESQKLQCILMAIRTNRALEIQYQSMNSTEPSTRWIVPHALGFDGYRWHVRAWCHRREKFLDFVLARVQSILGSRPEQVAENEDHAWQRTTILRLGPNPRLPDAQRQAVCLDFGMQNSVVEIEVRLSLVYYFVKQLLMDVAEHLPAERVQVVLLNTEEVNEALKAVGEAAIGA
jgi:predicted DNA-binding transcriptional regulator YafY